MHSKSGRFSFSRCPVNLCEMYEEREERNNRTGQYIKFIQHRSTEQNLETQNSHEERSAVSAH